MTKRALITGITGQDGSYLADYLLNLGYEVHGLVRRVALEAPETRFSRIAHVLDRITLHPASLESYASIFHVLSKHDFDECYHLAAQSFVAESFADGFSTMNMNINGTHYVLAALREVRPRCRFYFAGSSEMFVNASEVPQRDDPVSAAQSVRDQQARGISFNEELPRCVRSVLFERNLIQPRESATRLGVCYAQNDEHGRADQVRPRFGVENRQSRSAARLGPRR